MRDVESFVAPQQVVSLAQAGDTLVALLLTVRLASQVAMDDLLADFVS